MKSIFETAADLLGDVLSQDPQAMTALFALSPTNDVSLLDIAKWVIACEEAFLLSIPDEQVAGWHTLGDACARIEALLEEGQGENTERTEEDRAGWFYE